MTIVWDVATVDPATLTYVQEGSGAAEAALPAYHFVAGVLDILIPASLGPFGTTGNFIDVAVEDPNNTIPDQGMGSEVIMKVSENADNPAGFGVGLHYQFTGGGGLYMMCFPGMTPSGLDWDPAGGGPHSGCGVALQYTHGLEWAAGPTELASTTDPTNVNSPFWARLVVDPGSLVFTAEIWATDPLLGGSPVAVAGPIDPGITGAVAGDPTPCFVSRIDPGISQPINNELKVESWVVNQGLAPPTGADTITCSASPTSIVADGNQQSDLTATVVDTDGNPLAGETVVFTADSATPGVAGTCGPTTDHHNGIYTAKYTDTTVAGDVTITATDSTPATPLTAKCVIHQTPTATGNMGFGPPQVGIVRQGRS